MLPPEIQSTIVLSPDFQKVRESLKHLVSKNREEIDLWIKYSTTRNLLIIIDFGFHQIIFGKLFPHFHHVVSVEMKNSLNDRSLNDRLL